MKITKRARKISNVIIWITVVFLLVGAMGIIYKFTDGLQSDFKTFYVKYDDEDILSEKHDVAFFDNEKYRFEVRNLKNYLEEKKNFTVKVLPYYKDDTNFSFTLDGVEYVYSDVDDLTESFYIEIDEDGFTVTASESVKKVLEKKFANQEVGLEESFGIGQEYFRLEVTSEDEEVVNIYFSLNFGVDEVVLDKTGLVF